MALMLKYYMLGFDHIHNLGDTSIFILARLLIRWQSFYDFNDQYCILAHKASTNNKKMLKLDQNQQTSFDVTQNKTKGCQDSMCSFGIHTHSTLLVIKIYLSDPDNYLN